MMFEQNDEWSLKPRYMQHEGANTPVESRCQGRKPRQPAFVRLYYLLSDFIIFCQTLLFVHNSAFTSKRLFHRHRLRQITRLVHIRPTRQRRVIRQQLQRSHVEDR